MRMLPPVTRRPWGLLRLTACYLSILLVFSFICFEVLDLDGSDFSVTSKTPGIKLAESQDLRRAALASIQPLAAPACPLVDDHVPVLKFEECRVTGPVGVHPTLPRSPLTLPRAALDDPAA
jgi:hypothetical protein